MNNNERNNLGEALKTLAKQYGPPPTAQGVVKSVDESAFTCTVELANGLLLEEVQLKALKDAEKGVVVIPKVGSDVVVLLLPEPDNLIVGWTDVEKVLVDADTIVQFNGGNNGGVPIADNITEKLNAIEQDVNKLKQVFQSWTPVSQDGGAALKTAAAQWAGQQLQKTQANQLENDKVTH